MTRAKAKFQRNRRQESCKACRVKKAAHSHHVVYEQALDARGLPKHSLRNMMPLCASCHWNHHNGPPQNKLPLMLIADDTLDYAFEILGPFAFDYLRRRYSGHDDRLDERLRNAQETA